MNLEFGENVSPYTPGTPLYDIILNTRVDDDLSKRLVMMEAYDQTYGIYDHEGAGQLPENQLAIIRMHPAENMATGNRLRNLMRELVACRIPELLNEPLSSLLEYPLDVLEEYLVEGRKVKVATDEKQKQLEQQMKISLYN